MPHTASAVPAGTGPHTPSLPGRLHCSQGASHARSQQSPSAQKPEAQSLPDRQDSPGDRTSTQAPSTQLAPPWQSAMESVQEVRQPPPAAQV